MNSELTKKFAKARRLFPHTKKVIYFNCASTGPFSSTLQKALNGYLDRRVSAEWDDAHDGFAIADELRKDYARLIGAKKDQVGLGLNTSFGLNVAAFGLPLKRGDEVLFSDVEFPAVPYTLRAAAQARGLKLKMVKSRERRFDIGELEKAITKKSRLLALSWVQFFNGYKNDLKEIAAVCKKHGMFFVVDGIQGMGVEPINVRKLGIDVFTSGCQKWMCSPQGCGFFYLSDEVREQLTAPFMSWLGVDWQMNFSDLFYYDRPSYNTAREFEMGYFAVANLYGMQAAVEIFKQLGIRNIQRHNYELIDRLAAYIDSKPFYTITSSLDPKHRSSIFTFTCKNHTKLQREIMKRKIFLSSREGSIRVSLHMFNSRQDVDRLIAVLDSFAGLCG